MGWTFGNDPANSRLDRIRILIGDTDPSEPLIDDEPLLWILSIEPNDYLAASKACALIAAKFSRQADMSVGPLAVKFSQLADAYTELADRLALQATQEVSVDVKTDILVAQPKPPFFYRGQFERRS